MLTEGVGMGCRKSRGVGGQRREVWAALVHSNSGGMLQLILLDKLTRGQVNQGIICVMKWWTNCISVRQRLWYKKRNMW